MNLHIYRSLVDKILVPHTQFQEGLDRITPLIDAAHDLTESTGVAIVGNTRSGKSRLLEHIHSCYPSRREDSGLHQPIMRVRLYGKPTVKSFLSQLLNAVGDPLSHRGTEHEKTVRLIKLMRGAGTRALMVDEFQHFVDRVGVQAKPKVLSHVADTFKIVMDEVCLVVVVAGLPRSLLALDHNEQLAGRFTSPIRMPRYDWLSPTQRDEFIAVLEAIQPHLHPFTLPDLSSQNMAFRMYCASGGLIGYIFRTLRQAVWDAIDAERTVVTLEDLSQAYRKAVYEASVGIHDPFALDVLSKTPMETLLSQALQMGAPQVEEAEASPPVPHYRPSSLHEATARSRHA